MKRWILTAALAITMSGCAGYGGETVGETIGGRIQTDGEHCAVTLPEGWSWRPASWTAVSPLGTKMDFFEQLYGRPEYPEWEEAKSVTVDRYKDRTDVELTVEENLVRIDFGPEGGLSVLRKFDRVGCQMTFSYVEGAREQEIDEWEAIIASLERTSPTPGFTPEAG